MEAMISRTRPIYIFVRVHSFLSRNEWGLKHWFANRFDNGVELETSHRIDPLSIWYWTEGSSILLVHHLDGYTGNGCVRVSTSRICRKESLVYDAKSELMYMIVRITLACVLFGWKAESEQSRRLWTTRYVVTSFGATPKRGIQFWKEWRRKLEWGSEHHHRVSIFIFICNHTA